MHVDGAYGGAGLAAPSVRDQFSGIELAVALSLIRINGSSLRSIVAP